MRRRGQAGRVLPSILLLLFTGLGLFVLWAMALDVVRTIDSWSWTETRCLIVRGDVEDTEDGGFVYRLSYRYRAGGRDQTGERLRLGYEGSNDSADAYRLAAAFPPGAAVPCWVDPEDPQSAYLDRRGLWHAFWLLLPLAFVAVGGGGLWMLWGGRAGKAAGKASGGGDERAPAAAKSLGKRFAAGEHGCLAAFFSVFLFAGLGFGWLIVGGPALGAWRARAWVPAECEVLSSRVETHEGDDGDTYSVDVVYRYRHQGREYRSNRYHFFTGSSSGYEGKAEVVASYPPGRRFTCWVDPEDPAEAVIERGLGGEIWFGLVPLVFVIAGGGGMVFALAGGRKRKRRASGGERSARPGGRKAAADGPVALDPGVGPFGRFVGLVFVAAFWNGITGVFVWQWIEGWRAGSPDGCLAAFLLPFVAIGALLLVSVPFALLAIANPRPHLTLDPGRVPTGGSAELSWRFTRAAGRLRALKIVLEATETRVESSGSKTSSNVQPIRTVTVFETEDRALARAGSTRLTVPADAPPTKDAGDRRVSWKLKVAGAIRFWPDVAQDFALEVPPGPKPPKPRPSTPKAPKPRATEPRATEPAADGPPIPPPPGDAPTGDAPTGGEPDEPWTPPPAPIDEK